MPISALQSIPFWGRETAGLAGEMMASGLRAVITCIDEKKLTPDFSGRLFDEEFLRDLPPGTDPCGENGEFHSFVYDHPLFKKPIPHKVGEQVSREGFTFTDISGAFSV